MRQLVIALLLLPSARLSQRADGQATVGDVYPQGAWERVSSPTDDDWDAGKLNQLRQFVIDSANTTGMLVVYRGRGA